MSKSQSAPKKRDRKNIPVGIASVQATFNNTIISIADPNGNVIAWCSSGIKGFKGPKKSTPFAAQSVADDVAQKAMEHGVKTLLVVKVKGPGSGRESAVRSLASHFTVVSIKDCTPVPHNGARPPKRRRV